MVFNDTPIDYNLTCWYVNKRRVLELVGFETLSSDLRAAHSLGLDEQLRKLAELAVFKDAVTSWLRSNKPPTLGQILVQQQPCSGMIFTHYTNWFCKGLSDVERAIKRGKTPPLALAYAKLNDLREGWRIECRFHHDHLTSNSAWSELTGQRPSCLAWNSSLTDLCLSIG